MRTSNIKVKNNTVKTVKTVKTLATTSDMNKKMLEKLASLHLIPDSVYGDSIDKIKYHYRMIKLYTTIPIQSPIASLSGLTRTLKQIYELLENIITPLTTFQCNITGSLKSLSGNLTTTNVPTVTYNDINTQLFELSYHLRMAGYAMLKRDGQAGTTILFNTICKLRNTLADLMKAIKAALEEQKNLEEMLKELDQLNQLESADGNMDMSYEKATDIMDNLNNQVHRLDQYYQ